MDRRSSVAGSHGSSSVHGGVAVSWVAGQPGARSAQGRSQAQPHVPPAWSQGRRSVGFGTALAPMGSIYHWQGQPLGNYGGPMQSAAAPYQAGMGWNGQMAATYAQGAAVQGADWAQMQMARPQTHQPQMNQPQTNQAQMIFASVGAPAPGGARAGGAQGSPELYASRRGQGLFASRRARGLFASRRGQGRQASPRVQRQ